MKMVRVYRENDSILACADKVEYYASIGWTDKAPVKKVKAQAPKGDS